LDRQFLKKAIETIIFVSEKPVSTQKLCQVFSDLSHKDVQELVNELVSDWNILDRGFGLHEIAGGYQFRTSSLYSEFITKFKQLKPFRLSRAALEVLSIVAYRQPITRIEIDQIRGVDSSGVMALLLDKRLIEIKGRMEVVGRPFIYATTSEFMETFSLKSLKDLPTLKELEEIEKSLQLSLDGVDQG